MRRRKPSLWKPERYRNRGVGRLIRPRSDRLTRARIRRWIDEAMSKPDAQQKKGVRS